MSGFADYRPSAGLAPLAISVRAAALTDVEAMARIQVRAGRPARPEAYRRAVVDPDRLVVVAELDTFDDAATHRSVIGWAQTYHHTIVTDAAPAGHYLGGVTTDPDWRRGGVAVALTEARMAWIAERAEEAFYVVNQSNLASIDLHRRWAFREIARGPRLTGVEFPSGVGLLMRAALH